MKNKVAEAREMLGWTRAQLSRISGVSTKTIEMIEKEERTPYVDTSLKLARALHATVEEIFGVGVEDGD